MTAPKRSKVKTPAKARSKKSAKAKKVREPLSRVFLRSVGIDWDATDWRGLGYGGLTAVLLFAGGAGAIYWNNGTLPRVYNETVEDLFSFTADRGLQVADVLVEGRNRSSIDAILTKLDVERGTPILEFSPHTAKARIEELPWVKSATVERRLPNIVYVQLEERRPLALWQSNARMNVIDQSGEVITGARPAQFSSLPVIVGQDAPQHAHEVLALIESEPELKDRITAAVLVSGRRWNLRLDNGVDIKLPEENPQAAWAYFAEIEREASVLERDVIAVDLRLPDRLIVRTADGVRPGKRRPKNEKAT
ncbi:cell division protein FtsQ/DivIB [Kiloniella sp. b19]|uniref:cell division protein FtsQ/DivIB n=1 Tax=Kiloniella sp. GXU_MW_B19 TaxID=3141326 RepID=UPI0031D9C6F6